jgi:hypothetical protein
LLRFLRNDGELLNATWRPRCEKSRKRRQCI